MEKAIQAGWPNVDSAGRATRETHSRIKISRPFTRPIDREEAGDFQHVEPPVSWEVALNANDLLVTISELEGIEQWKEALPDLLPDFGILLHDALDLLRELSCIEYWRVESNVAHLPISHHSQNRHFFGWTVLIDLIRDAWLLMAKQGPRQARLVARAGC